MLEKWIGTLTAAGYDIAGCDGHTMRGDGWNTNHPMPSLVMHFHNGERDIVLNAYATNSHHWTFYAYAFSGKKSNRYKGFNVTGTREKEISTLAQLEGHLA